MRQSKRVGLAGLAFLAAGTLYAQEAPPQTLLALAKRDHTLAIIDPVTFKVLAKVPVGEDPHEVIASSDGKVAYVSNYGFGAFHTITTVDLVNQKPLSVIDLGALSGPHGLAFAGGKAWFTAEGAKVIGSYDPGSDKIDWVLGTGQDRTHMLYVFPDLTRIVATNVASGTVSLIEKSTGTAAGPPPFGKGPPPNSRRKDDHRGPPPMGGPKVQWEQTVIAVGKGPEGFDVSPDGREVWVANGRDGTISIIALPEKKVIATLDANAESANRLKFTPDGKRVLVSMLGGPDVAVFDAATRKELKRIPVGTGAAGILMQPDGARAYIGCSPDDYIAVIDLNSLTVVGKIEPGEEPDGLAWAVRPL